MDYKCPVCGQNLCSLDAFSRHVEWENQKIKKEEADATFKRLNELEKKIRSVYGNLRKDVDEYNKLSNNLKCSLSLSFREVKEKKMTDDDLVKYFAEALFGGTED